MKTAKKNKIDKRTIALKKRMAIVTCCTEDWGGSEELWRETAIWLNNEDFKIMICKKNINKSYPKFIDLSKRGVLLKELNVLPKASRYERLFLKVWKIIRNKDPNDYRSNFENLLKKFKPGHVLISQGINFDGLVYAHSCMALNISYSILSHKAVEFYWPPPNERKLMIDVYRKARKCFFVSYHNQMLTEEQVGFRLANAQIVRNPIKLKQKIIPYPSTENGFKLACIGRLFIIDKGQDILLRVLSQKKWQKRSLSVSFIGTGIDEEGLKKMAALLDVTNIEFKGYIDNPEKIWKEHHALVLPSRSEGLPLVLIEAMAVGRMVIASRAGGNEEVIEDEVTGFLGEVNFSCFDALLEKAWFYRTEWETMGEKAYQYICENMPKTPEINFAKQLIELIYE